MKNLILMLSLFFSLSSVAAGPSEDCTANSFGFCVDLSPVNAGTSVSSSNIDTVLIFGQSNANTQFRASEIKKVAPSECVLIEGCQATSMPLNIEYSDFVLRFSDFNKPKADKENKNCACLSSKFKTLLGQDLEAKKKEETAKINKKILEAYGRKFINDFSSNLEDASFFLTKNRDMFKDPKNAKSIQCNDPALYDDMINTTCGERGITDQNLMKSRKDYFINSLGGDKKPFEEKILELTDQIQSMPFPKGKGKDGELLYTRFAYDESRLGLAHKNQLGLASDHIVKTILQNPELKEELVSKFFEPGDSPVQSIFKLIAAKKTDPEFLKKFDSKLLGGSFMSMNSLEVTFKFLMNTHPGFMNLMEDNTALSMVINSLKEKPQSSILEILENDPLVLEPVLNKRCADLIIQFANAVCVKDEDLIKQMEPDDLETLLHGTFEQDHLEPELHELLICENNNKEKASKFKNLANLYNSDLPARRSDFLERLLEKDIYKHKNNFTRSMLGDEQLKKEMAIASEQGRQFSKGVSAGGVASANVYAKAVSEGKAFSFGEKPLMSKHEAKEYLKESKKYEKNKLTENLASASGTKKESKTENKTDSSPVNTQVKSTEQSKVSIPSISPKYVSPKQELSNQLTKTFKPAEVEKAISNVDIKTANELNRLRNREVELLQRTYDLESNRMQDMQKRVEELQAKITKAPEKVPTKIVTEVPIKANEPEKEKAPSAVLAQGTISAPVRSQQAPSPVTANATAPVINEVSNGRGKSPELKTNQNALTVVNDVQNASPAEIAPDKIQEEVSKLIDRSDESLTSMDEIKAKGIRIKIKVMENNSLTEKEVIVPYNSLDQRTKDLLELKFAKDEKEQQVSKLAVLRMLINQSRVR